MHVISNEVKNLSFLNRYRIEKISRCARDGGEDYKDVFGSELRIIISRERKQRRLK
jgi:hypothetical protein